jgi:hypothetical protein
MRRASRARAFTTTDTRQAARSVTASYRLDAVRMVGDHSRDTPASARGVTITRQAAGSAHRERHRLVPARAPRNSRSSVGCEGIGMSAGGVPLSDVLARWAYSEVNDGHASYAYDNKRGVLELRAKRTNGVSFDELSAAECGTLADHCRAVRKNLLVDLGEIERFDIAEVSRDALADFLVPRIVSDLPAIVRFADYMTTTSDHPRDARNVKLRHPTYEPHTDPVTVGRRHERAILLDGYHRAALFWKFGPADGTLLAYRQR